MAVFVGVLRVSLNIPESSSLKDKRHYVKSIAARLQTEFRLAVAEVGQQDIWTVAEIAAVGVANEAARVDGTLARALDFVERTWPELEVRDVETEVLQAF